MTRWCGAPIGAYEWREWSGEAVVFVHATGDTHALSFDASSVLAAMRSNPGDSHPSGNWIALAGFDALDVESAEVLLQGLADIGLVRRDAP